MLYGILIGAIAGFLAGKLMKGGGFGILINIILGIIGGFVGSWLFGLAGISPQSIRPKNCGRWNRTIVAEAEGYEPSERPSFTPALIWL